MVSKILKEDIEALKVASLPTRPTAPSSFGGRGYSAAEMKAAFDKLPLFIVEKFNLLIDAINGCGSESVTESIPTGIYDGHTLSQLLRDVKNGSFAAYLDVYGKSLVERIEELRGEVNKLKLGVRTREMNGNEARLSNCENLRFGKCESLSILPPESCEEDFHCLITFDSAEAPTSLTYPKSTIRFSGRSVVGEDFVPEPLVHYTAIFWYDGALQCHVRGVDNERRDA